MIPLGAILSIGEKVLDKVLPDPEAKAKAQASLMEMAQRGVAPEGVSLYEFWRIKVENYMSKALAKEELLLNLASSEYSDLIQAPKLRSRMVTPQFFEANNGQLKAVSVFSKQARGTMARWCAQNAIDNAEEIKNFTGLGYTFVAAQSSTTDWVFIR